MTTKQTLKNKAVNWIASNEVDLGQTYNTEVLNRLVDSLFAEFTEVWMQGVDTGVEMNQLVERERVGS